MSEATHAEGTNRMPQIIARHVVWHLNTFWSTYSKAQPIEAAIMVAVSTAVIVIANAALMRAHFASH